MGTRLAKNLHTEDEFTMHRLYTSYWYLWALVAKIVDGRLYGYGRLFGNSKQ